MRAGHGGRAARRRHRGERALAAHRHLDRRHGDARCRRRWRRRLAVGLRAPQVPQARDPRRRRARHPHAARRAVHRQLLHRRRRAQQVGRRERDADRGALRVRARRPVPARLLPRRRHRRSPREGLLGRVRCGRQDGRRRREDGGAVGARARRSLRRHGARDERALPLRPVWRGGGQVVSRPQDFGLRRSARPPPAAAGLQSCGCRVSSRQQRFHKTIQWSGGPSFHTNTWCLFRADFYRVFFILLGKRSRTLHERQDES